LGLIAAFFTNALDWGTNRLWYSMMLYDNYAISFIGLMILTVIFIMLIASYQFRNEGSHIADIYALMIFVLVGALVMTSYSSLVMLFIGIEILSIALYILVGSRRMNLSSNEASLKYFLMGAFASGFLLFGITLVYGVTGSFDLAAISDYANGTENLPIIFNTGLILILIGFAFKIGAVPFHFWTPDVYDGAPSVFTSFMSTIVKAAGMLAFIRVFENQYTILGPTWHIIVDFAIVTTLLVGNITAVFQQSVKRMLAYSSIAQAGFMLFALYASNTEIAKEGILLYAAAYSLATISIFAVLIKLQDYTLDGFNGLAKKEPVLAFAATVSLLSLSGIPLTAGFFAKYYVLAGALQAGGALWLIIVAVLLAAVSVYYYFRVIQAMYFKEGDPQMLPISGGFKAALIVVAALIVLLGIWPSLLLSWLYF
jgi:NADH-quinone oxidoreductase subunit N